MEWHEIEVDGRHTVKFTDLPYVPLTSPSQSQESTDLFNGKKLGGILRHGEWGWLAKNSVIQVVSLRNGQTISSYDFCESCGYESCYIKCVEELYPNNPEIMLLAVVLESFSGPGGIRSYVAVYSVELSKVLDNIVLGIHLTCARFMEASACRRSLLQNFDGCLAVGGEKGIIVLLDLNVGKLISMQNELNEDLFVPCHITDYSLPLTEIHRNFRQCQQDGVHFGLQMEVTESPTSIQCILPIDLILGLAIGLEDGRLVLYDLAELQIFFVALPSPEVTMSSLVKMDFLEPPDDPRPCLFIWSLHENGENLHAILHSLMYEKRLVDEKESTTYFETFQTCSMRLQLPLEATKSEALACQAISSMSMHGEDDANCLCIISWLSELEGKNKLLIFDLNQWYKEEMPFVLNHAKQPNYLAGYILSGECDGLQTLVNPHNIAHFNSIQRFEEHFYPNSLSFESLLLHTDGCRSYNWEGAQNRVVNLLRSSNAAIFLEPNFYFNEIIRTRLMPQFIDMNLNSAFSRKAKYEVLLSAALEHNCVSLLRDCAKSWIDGSFMGNFSATTGLSLSTLTDWIWKRATCIKSRCNDLCKSLFEFGGYPLDNREQKELGFITRQLKLLAELLKDILVYAKRQIPERVFSDLASKQNSLSMASSYQDILLWLLNIGLLPEASPHNDKINAGNDLIPYPYQNLKNFYNTKRSFYSKLNEKFVSKKTGSCKLLFIDSFVEHACKGNVLHEFWLENEGNGLYPPNSVEAMLRVMLVPDLDYDSKCAILLYFFLDLNMAIDEVAYKDVVANFIKFPSVFKLSAALIKTVQAFWNLDHDHYMSAVDEFISPFNKNQSYPQWQVELLIEVLLNQKSNNLALRILESQPSLISPLLKLNTLLANDLISEAFHFVRSKNDETLLETFFTSCLLHGQFGIIRDLALSEQEGLILQNILKKIKTPGAESLHFVYLLQKSKYIEAVSYMEEMSNRLKGLKASSRQTINQMDTPNLVLSAFNTTMTPVTQGLTDVYFRIKNKIKKKEIDNQSPVPLSCQLIKQNANGLLGGIYHSSALSAHFATYYWGEMEEQTQQTKHLLNSNNAPFLRKAQIDTNLRNFSNKNNICYPQTYKVNEKRSLIESEVLENERDELERHKIEYKLNPKKKRRLIGQEIVEDLQHFEKLKKSLKDTEFNFGKEQQQAKDTDTPNKESFDLLLRPLNKKPKEIVTEQTEIQSILKSNLNDGCPQRDILNDEEKSLRFRLPSIETSSTELMEAEEEVKPHNDKLLESNKEEVEKSQLENSPKFKHFSRSLSVDSCKSSSSNKSEENFYSPLSSHNNTKLDTSNLSMQSILSGPQPRKPLARFSAERSEKSVTPEPLTRTTDKTQYLSALETNIKSGTSLEHFNTEQEVSKESSNLAYVTAKETFSLPQNSDTDKRKLTEEALQTTSGFSSLSTQATMAGSKIIEFLPKESSSKVGEANEPAKLLEPVKMSERSTVVGTLTSLECTTSASNIAMQTELSHPTDEQKRRMMETTLSMSSYDVSILETTSLQQTKSSILKVTIEKDSVSDIEDNKKETEIELKKELAEEKLLIENNEKAEEKQDKSPTKLPQPTEESNDVCIILSSSSSSSSSSSPYQEHKDRFNENSDKEGEGDEEDDPEEDFDIDNEDCEEQFNYEDNTADYMEDDVNFYVEEEEINDYDDEYEDNEDISMEDSDNSGITDNAINLIDSSSELEQRIENSNSDSDSDDDVNFVEEDDISTDVLEENTDIKEILRKAKENVVENTSNADKPLVPTTEEAEREPSYFAEQLRENEATMGNTPSQADIRINDVFETSKTEVVTEKEINNSKADKCVLMENKEAGKASSESTENQEELAIRSNTSPQIDVCVNEALSTSTTEKERNSSEVDKSVLLVIKEAAKVPSDGTEKEEQVAIVENTSSHIEIRINEAISTAPTQIDIFINEAVSTATTEKESSSSEADKSVLLEVEGDEKVLFDATEKQEEVAVIENTPPQIDIVINETVSTFTTELVKANYSTDLKQKEGSNYSKEKQEKELKETEDVKKFNEKPIEDFKNLEKPCEEEKLEFEEVKPTQEKLQIKENKDADYKLTIPKSESSTERTEIDLITADSSEILEKGEIKSIKEKAAEKLETLNDKTENEESLEQSISFRVEDSNESLHRSIEGKDAVQEKEEHLTKMETETSSEKIDIKTQEALPILTEQATGSKSSDLKEKSKKPSSIAEEKENKQQKKSDKANIKNKPKSEEKAEDTSQEKTKSTDQKKKKEVHQKIQNEPKVVETMAEGNTKLTGEIEKKEERKIEEEIEKESKVVENKSEKEDKPQLSDENWDKKAHQKEEISAETHKDRKFSQSKHATSRRSLSVPPKELEPQTDSTPGRLNLFISNPLETNNELEETATPRTRRNVRASSLQPRSKLEDTEISSTPRKIQKTQDSDETEPRTTRSSSVPPVSVESKLTRHRSILLEPINEDASLLDSPSTRTRLRSRLNSGESEVDSPFVQQKRTRKMSISHETLFTPKRTRRDSIASQPETSAGTPRTLRAKSVLTVQKEEEQEEKSTQTPKRKRHVSVTSQSETNVSVATPRSRRSRSVLSAQEEDASETVTATPKGSTKKNDTKRQKISEETSTKQISPKSDSSSPTSAAAAYSSARRLTRTQLAVMAKSAALNQALASSSTSNIQEVDSGKISPTQNKRPKSRNLRSSHATGESDDAESVSSKISTASNVTSSKRVTRSSLKEKDDVEDDGASIASSVGSEKQHRTRRSKDKSSPNSTLTTIPEDATVELKKRGRPPKH